MSMVDFSIFDHEEIEEAGQELEAYCPRCKTETLHTIAEDEEEEGRQVRCSNCEHIHTMRTTPEEEETTPHRKKGPKAKPTWEHVVERNKKEVRPYNINEIYAEMEVISHPTFGMGFVSDVIDAGKMEVSFQHDKKILIYNRLGKQVSLPALLKTEEKAKIPVMDPELTLLETRKDVDMDELLDLEEDILLGNSTKLSPEAWEALQKEDETDEIFSSDDEEENEEVDEDDSDEEKPARGKAKTKSGKKKAKSATGSSSRKNKVTSSPSSGSNSTPSRRTKPRKAS